MQIPVWATIAGAALGGWLLLLCGFAGPVLRRLGRVERNFRGDLIPASYGVIPLIWFATVALVYRSSSHRWFSGSSTGLAAVVVGFGLLGLADDVWGDKSIKGLKGHLRAALTERRITTGFTKAVGGLALGGVAAGILGGSPASMVVNTLIISLAANCINLLDLRPGRAGAVSILLGILLLIARRGTSPGLLFVLLPAIPVYLRDAKAQVMMGDVGSNLLGASLGLAACGLPAVARVTLVALLIAFHLLTERLSLTRLIEQTPWLARLDRMTGVR